MDSLREVADYLVNGVWEKEDNHGWKRQYHEEGGAVFGRDGKMIPVTFGPGYPRMEPPTSRELPPPLPLLPMPEPEPLPIPMPGNVPAAMEEEPPAAPPVAVNPWDRQPPELFMPPYPSWHPINAGRKETDEHVVALGERALVIDASDIRMNPEGSLRALCSSIDLEWDRAMLSWATGPKPFDGVWSAHWYDAVHRSSGFAKVEKDLPQLRGDLASVNEKALPLYERLAAHKLPI